MTKVVLISCVKMKQNHNALAKEMYISSLFKLSLKYAEKLKPDKIFILSAKYHLLPLNQKIKPYNVTLNTMHIKERRTWAEEVIQELSKQADLQSDNFVLLAGEKYIQFIRKGLKHVKEPLKGLSIGNRLQFLKSKS